MYDVLIIGGGPAGVTAAVYCVRGGLKAAVVYKDAGALTKAEKIENYYGFERPLTGAELFNAGLAQARRIGAEIFCDEAVGLALEEHFTVFAAGGSYDAEAVILATGSVRAVPKIRNLAAFENAGVSYCAVCDAFFYRKKITAVLGGGEYALAEVRELLPVAGKVVVLTDGKNPEAAFPSEVEVIVKKIDSLTGDGNLSGVTFADGQSISVSGLFVALGSAGSGDLAKKIGAVTEVSGNDAVVKTDSKMQTSVPGLFAAGDCTGGLKQIAKAVHEGAVAGMSAVSCIRRASAKGGA